MICTLCLMSCVVWTQIPTAEIRDTVGQDDMGVVTDVFQELFFDALAQQAIENPEKAVENLKKSMETAPDKSVVYYLLGENYKALQDFEAAAANLEKARAARPQEKAIQATLLEVYRQAGKYDKALEIVRKLAKEEPAYHQEAAVLLALKKEELSAFKTIRLIRRQKTLSPELQKLRLKLLREAADKPAFEHYLQSAIRNNPQDVDSYSDLIYLYTFQDPAEEAYKVAVALQKLDPEADEPHLIFCTYYRNRGDREAGLRSLKIVAASDRIAEEVKQKVLTDFDEPDTPPVQNERYADKIPEDAADTKENETLRPYEQSLAANPHDFKLIQKVLQLQLDNRQYAAAAKLAEEKITLFPTQPDLYFLKGKAENALENYDVARLFLEDGADFVVENEDLLSGIYRELIRAYTGLEQPEKVQTYKNKLNAL